MSKTNKKITLIAIAIISLAMLCGVALFYKKQQAVAVKSNIVQKVANDQPLSSFSPIYSLNEFIQFNKEFDSLFHHNALVFDNSFSQINQGTLSSTLKEKEEPNQFLFSINIPGINPKDINISIQNRTLCITATKKSQSYFYYRFLLPDTADSEKITAKTKYGVLEIIIPKTEKVPSKNVVIQEE
ncbi:Hsp20/alpha crystallin family protein [Rickettsiella endosymbiont of Dermanyssus gallinae]|uniref:Hsp20/alpha crystallin family protein n=1 Tax=Rickettsiella endosymbiont of Dermanyssus gallinae TaxID=2856608 RepID=UPI001C533D99|nr:Hsp20/alpha crystallin family protein [Rickettsiella endosymbiont of Dermanyssus gallinae]